MLEAGRPALERPANDLRPTRSRIARVAIPGHARARLRMMLGLSPEAAAFYERVIDRADVGLWELDYSDVDASVLSRFATNEAELLRAVVYRPDLFHTLLDKTRVLTVNERGAAIAGFDSADAAISARSVRFVRSSADSARVAQLIALAFHRPSFERDIEVGVEEARGARYRMYWHVIEAGESGLPSRVAVAVVESPQDTAGATREG